MILSSRTAPGLGGSSECRSPEGWDRHHTERKQKFPEFKHCPSLQTRGFCSVVWRPSSSKGHDPHKSSSVVLA